MGTPALWTILFFLRISARFSSVISSVDLSARNTASQESTTCEDRQFRQGAPVSPLSLYLALFKKPLRFHAIATILARRRQSLSLLFGALDHSLMLFFLNGFAFIISFR